MQSREPVFHLARMNQHCILKMTQERHSQTEQKWSTEDVSCLTRRSESEVTKILSHKQ